jgi:uncharacterized membrane protein YkoI
MSTIHRLSSVVGLGLVVVAGALLVASARRTPRRADGHEEKIEMSKVPAPVQAAARKFLPKLDACTAALEKEKGETFYEIQGKGEGSMNLAVLMTESGQVVEVEREVPAERLPAAARAEIEKRVPGGTVAKVEDLEKHSFEVQVVGVDGKKTEVQLSVTGRARGREDDEEGDEDEEHEKH